MLALYRIERCLYSIRVDYFKIDDGKSSDLVHNSFCQSHILHHHHPSFFLLL